MTRTCLFYLLSFWSSSVAADLPLSEAKVRSVIKDRNMALVMIDAETMAASIFNPELAREKLAPCSTFKIWNTLIGCETGNLKSPEQLFYQWDGVKRSVPEWNQELTLRGAFQASCVPAYQSLARKIGIDAMKRWLARLNYGDQDLSAGIDQFWLPAKGRKPLLITAEEQAHLMARLSKADVPFSKKAQAITKEVMLVRKLGNVALYGKTGSGANDAGKYNLGWFVGYVDVGNHVYAYAMVAKDEGLSGKAVRQLLEAILSANGML